MFFAPQKVLVVASHPDDEMLGCAGYMAKLAATGVEITILLLGEGPTARNSEASTVSGVCSAARECALSAAAVLGIGDVRFANLPDNRFDSVPLLDVIKLVEGVGEAVRPDMVLTHFAGDLNIDHHVTHRAVLTAFRPLPGVKPVTILNFEVLSSTEFASPCMGTPFIPTVYVNIETFLEKKRQALHAYAPEMRTWPHPRSFEAMEAQARLRGSQCGCAAAEAFILCRTVT